MAPHAKLDDGAVDMVLRKGSTVAAEGLSAFDDADGPPGGLAAMLHERGVTRLFLAG